MKSVILVLMMLAVATSAFAQSQYEELLRQDLRTAKTEVVTEAMMLSDAEGEISGPSTASTRSRWPRSGTSAWP